MHLQSCQQTRQHIRNHIRQLRRALTADEQQQAALSVTHCLLSHPKIKQAQNISLFLSFDGEIETRGLIEQLWRHQKQVYLPVLHPFSSGNLLFLHYSPQTHLIKNRLGIVEPKLDVRHVLPQRELDVIITPLVAFDSTGQRLGMGGGYYDRTLQHWRENGTYPIGIAHDCQRVDSLPIEKWDIPLPEIVTPSQNWKWES